eukprot:765081-Hanusia_phi.AAC.1
MCVRVKCPEVVIPSTMVPDVSPLPILFHDDNISFGCITGYRLDGSLCWSGNAKSYVRCVDGQVEFESSCTSSACGCSYSPCFINESSSLFGNVATWNVSGNGTELLMDGGIPQVLHGGKITLKCKDGYRPKLISAMYPPEPDQSSGFEAHCTDCTLTFNYTCEAVACDSLPLSSWLDSVSMSHPSFVDTVTLTCKQGSVLSWNGTESLCSHQNTSYQVSCDSRGKFDSFECRPTLCPAYDSFIVDPNLERTTFSLVHVNESLQVKCKYGFRMGSRDAVASPYAEVRCLSNCSFSSPAECRLVQCAAFAIPANATAELIHSNFSELSGGARQDVGNSSADSLLSLHGDLIHVTCNPGYHVRVNDTCFSQYDVNCTDGNLSQAYECVPEECGLLVLRAGEDQQNQSSDDMVTITCQTGYRASESPTNGSYLCNNSQSYEAFCDGCYWDRRNFSCNKIQCPPLNLLDPNVEGDFAYVEYNDLVNVTCQTGFRAGSNLANSSRTSTARCNDMCAYDGWTCLPVLCPSMLFPNHLPTVAAGHLSIVTLSCQEGYHLADENCSTSYNVTCEDGLYPLSEINTCVQATCNVSDIGDPFVEILNSTFDFLETVTFTCQEGYRAVPKTYSGPVNCSENRSYEASCGLSGWDAEAHCRPITCAVSLYGDPTVLVDKPSLEYREVVNVTCRLGFVPSNYEQVFSVYGVNADCTNAVQRSFEIGCEASCNVSNQLKCISAFCPDPQLGWSVSSSTAVNESVQVACPDMKKFDGEPTLDAMGLTCTEKCQYRLVGVTGRDEPYRCVSFDCTLFSRNLSNAHIIGGGTQLNETLSVEITCDLGYALEDGLLGTPNDTCATSSLVNCYDSQMLTACSRKIPCGCGTGPCVINTSALGEH